MVVVVVPHVERGYVGAPCVSFGVGGLLVHWVTFGGRI
jgi:hypothetical protein